MDAYPEGVSRTDHRGWSPLHVACSMGTDLDIIEMLLEDYPETVLLKTHKGSDCIKCAKMSKGHPNEAAICQYIEKKMAEVEGRKAGDESEESGEDGEEKKEAQDNDSDDESHHQDDDEVDLLDLGGNADSAASSEGGGVGEGDLLGLASDNDANYGEKTKNDDLLLDMGPADAQDVATTPDVEGNAEEENTEALLPMPMSAPPPPPPPTDPQSTTNGNENMNSVPLAFMPAEASEESPTSTVDTNFLSPRDKNLNDDKRQPISDLVDGDMLGDIVLEEGSADIVKALEGNLIDL